MAKYKRVLLKLSGEALQGNVGYGVDPHILSYYGQEIKSVVDVGVQVAVVIGGGNIWRGEGEGKEQMDQAQSHFMGMLATVINTLALQDALEQIKVPTRAMTAIRMESIAEPYIRRRAIRHLEKGRVVIFGGGTGNPFFTTDSAATLRGAEIHADVLLMGKNGVDGVYSADPKKDPTAYKLEKLDYMHAVTNNLRIMDQTALTFARERKLPIVVFDVQEPGTLLKVVKGEQIGSLIGDNL
jgi:uridylate kinase